MSRPSDLPRRARSRRWLIAGGGVVVLLVIAGLLYVRRVDPVEVTATLLFIPVFAGVLLWRLPGGLAAGLAAAGVYAALRYPAMQIVGADQFAGLLAARTVGYLAFGGIGGWAMGSVRHSLDKLDLYDQRDDATGLGNARFLVQSLELEISRSRRYQTVFSVAVVDIPTEPLDALSRRARQRLLGELGAEVTRLIRTVDRAVHVWDGRLHRVAVVLPETPRAGADVFAARFRDWVVDLLHARGTAPDPARVRLAVHTYPGDDEQLSALREELAALIDAPASSDATA